MTRDVSDITHRKSGLRFEKSQFVEIETWARPDKLVAGATRVVGGADWKVSIERWYLSPYVEKPFNSKVIKSFVPELRSRKCFSCFGILMFYAYMLWTFYVHFTYSCTVMLHTHTHTYIYIYIYIYIYNLHTSEDCNFDNQKVTMELIKMSCKFIPCFFFLIRWLVVSTVFFICCLL